MSKIEVNFCDYCICKTCAIAQKNGGAEGCGDCETCKKSDHSLFSNGCKDYYNPKKIGDVE